MRRDKKIKKKKLGSYPFVSVVFSITLALFVMGLFGLLILFAGNFKKVVQANVEMNIFLNNNLSENEVLKIVKTLSVKDYVVKGESEAKVKLITKEEAAKQFIEDTGEDFVTFLGDNPLRDVVSINIHPDFHSNESLAEIKKEIEYIRGVYEVSYIPDLINSINDNVKVIGYVLLVFSAILLIAVIILIHNTIKLALFSQRFLIRSMQLVGGTARFIRRPFLQRSIGFGALSALLAMTLLAGFLKFILTYVGELLDLVTLEELGTLAGALITIGIIVGYFSTRAAMKRYMKMSLDELY